MELEEQGPGSGRVVLTAVRGRPTADCGDRARAQRRTLAVLVATQVLGGAGMSAAVAVGGLTAARMSGSDAVGGLAQTATAVGAALVAGPLARAATRSGRRTAMRSGYLTATAGALAAAVAVVLGSWPSLIAASALLGAATATTLAARYAGTDLAAPHRRARALSVVLWATTSGAVSGPNLAEPARALLGDTDAGPYLLCGALFALAAVGVHSGLRPDPLLLARACPELSPTVRPAVVPAPGSPRLGTAAIMVAQSLMVGLMSMAPVHLAHGGAGLRVVGVVISVHVAAMYGVSPLFGWLADRIGRLPVLAVGGSLLTTAGVVAGLSGPHDAVRLSCGLAALGLGWSAVLVSGSALIVDATPPADRVRTQGRTDVLMNVSGALGGAAAGVTVATSSYGHLGIAAATIAAGLLTAVLLAGAASRRGNGRTRTG